MEALKYAFDPSGLLNPGKVIPTLHRCAEYGRCT
jgi:glycolate oxidase